MTRQDMPEARAAGIEAAEIRRRGQSLAVVGYLGLFGAVAGMFLVFAQGLRNEVGIWGVALVVLSAYVGLAWRALRIRLRKRERLHSQLQQESLRVAQRIAETPTTSFTDFLHAELRVVTEKARLNMTTAEQRADRLYRIGTAFMVASVIAPLVAGLVYVALNPFSEANLGSFVRLAGRLPSSALTGSLERDWRILIAGISFGFLFLAAARGIMNHHVRQTATYFDLAKDVAHFENLASALRIRARSKDNPPDDAIKDVLSALIAELRRPPTQVASRTPPVEDSEETLGPYQEQLSEVLRLLKMYQETQAPRRG